MLYDRAKDDHDVIDADHHVPGNCIDTNKIVFYFQANVMTIVIMIKNNLINYIKHIITYQERKHIKKETRQKESFMVLSSVTRGL